MDDLTIVVCMCIGTAVAWLMALYTREGMILLIWNVSFGMAGAALCALAVTWSGSPLGAVWLLAVGPFSAWLAIVAGHAVRRAVLRSLA